MRRRMMCVPMILLCLVLTACGGKNGGGKAAEELALTIRAEHIAMNACTAHAEITADYGQRVYAFGLDLAWEKEGDLLLTLTAPEMVAGAVARIRAGETWLEFDGARLETGPLSSSGLSPVDAIPTLLSYAQVGFMAECGMVELDGVSALRVDCRDPDLPAGSGNEVSLWFDAGTHALLRGELASDGFTVIQCVFSNFSMT